MTLFQLSLFLEIPLFKMQIWSWTYFFVKLYNREWIGGLTATNPHTPSWSHIWPIFLFISLSSAHMPRCKWLNLYHTWISNVTRRLKREHMNKANAKETFRKLVYWIAFIYTEKSSTRNLLEMELHKYLTILYTTSYMVYNTQYTEYTTSSTICSFGCTVWDV